MNEYGHRWTAGHDDDRMECLWCMISPLDPAAREPCDRYMEAKYYGQTNHIEGEGNGD